MNNLLGGKGANLAEMTNTGLSISPGMVTLNASGFSQYKNFFRKNY